MASIINIENNHVVMSGIKHPGISAEWLASNSEFLRLVDENLALERIDDKVIARDNFNRDSVSDELYVTACWATEEEWKEFDGLMNRDHGLWFYDKVNITTPLYVAEDIR